MKITTKGRYAMRVMLDLAEQNGQNMAAVRGISERQGVSPKYLEQIMTRLVRAGLAVGTRGSAGGYRLAKPTSEISAADILAAVEQQDAVPLSEDENPKAAQFWLGFEKTVSDYLKAQTLEEILKNSRASRRDPSIWIL